MIAYFGKGASALDNDTKYLPSSIEGAFGPGTRTNIDAGDVMVFTSWTPHRTYIPRNVRADRLSAEVRLVADALPSQSYFRELRSTLKQTIKSVVHRQATG
jgi:hypothetical protein